MLRCSNRRRERLTILKMFKQKKEDAENTVLQISFIFSLVFVRFNAPIHCCIPCFPTLIFLSIMLLNFVFFGIWVRRSYQPSIQPHIAPINCCIFCLPTLDFLSIRILSYLILSYLILSILSYLSYLIYLIYLSYLILSYLAPKFCILWNLCQTIISTEHSPTHCSY